MGPVSRRRVLGLGVGVATLGTACAGSAPAAGSDEPAAEPVDEPDELDELFADLTDRRGDHRPIEDDERRARLARGASILSEAGLDALLIEPGSTLSYLTEVRWGRSERLFGLVLLADGSVLWICPAFEVPRAEERIAAAGPAGPVVPWDEHEYAYAPLAAALRERGVERIAVDPGARAFVAHSLAAELGPDRVVSGLPVVRALRGCKSASEIALLRAANELTQEAIAAVAERLEPGTTDHRIGAMIRRAQHRLGLTGVWVLPLIGEGAAYPHGGPEGRTLAVGDVILVDTGGSLHGYQSDNTRTWTHGRGPEPEVERAWNAVRDAQRRAFETLRPGVPCKDVDRAARDVITAAGYGEGYTSFAHRLGHGIGLDGHEEPYLDGGSEVILEPGMTFSDEPGIYLPGRFGIRLEDIVVVTADGADHFGSWQAAPSSPA